jgi:hypothetical protein
MTVILVPEVVLVEMSNINKKLNIQPVLRGEDGGTGDRWIASLDFDNSPAYDGSGHTIEEALVSLVLQMAEAL